jgi:hypothetical protein
MRKVFTEPLVMKRDDEKKVLLCRGGGALIRKRGDEKCFSDHVDGRRRDEKSFCGQVQFLRYNLEVSQRL